MGKTDQALSPSIGQGTITHWGADLAFGVELQIGLAEGTGVNLRAGDTVVVMNQGRFHDLLLAAGGGRATERPGRHERPTEGKGEASEGHVGRPQGCPRCQEALQARWGRSL